MQTMPLWLQLAIIACKLKEHDSGTSQTNLFLDFVNKTKNTTQAKILRNICRVLFVEIIVSERNILIKITSFMLISRLSLKLQTNRVSAAHRQCARDANSLKPNDGTLEP